MGWTLQQMNMPGGQRPNAPAAAGPLNVSTYTGTQNPHRNTEQQHLGYRDSQGVIWDVWWNGFWNLQPINNRGGTFGGQTAGPLAVAGPFIGVHVHQQHWAYIDSDGFLWDSWYDGNGNWNLQKINQNGNVTTNGPLAMTGVNWVAVWNDGTGAQGHFTYVGIDGAIYDAFSDNDLSEGHKAWNLQKISGGPNALTNGPAPTSSPFESNFLSGPTQQHIVYQGTRGDIYDCWYDGNGHWNAQKINNGNTTPNQGRTNLPPAAPGTRPYVWINQDGTEQHFTYLGTSGAIFDAYYDSKDNGWLGRQVTLGAGAVGGLIPLTKGPVSVSAPFECNYGDSQQHIVYRDASGTIQDAWRDDSGNWQQQHINQGGETRGPAAASDVFVWVTGNQQHFAYLDAKGVIWDAYYTN